jgi:Rrf2 family protein
MDLALTRRGDYAVRAALCLASRGGDGRYVKIREVAQTMALPASYTPQVLRLLADAGLAEARAGRDGGYRLTRPPGEVALLEVVEAAEGAFVRRARPRSPGAGPASARREGRVVATGRSPPGFEVEATVLVSLGPGERPGCAGSLDPGTGPWEGPVWLACSRATTWTRPWPPPRAPWARPSS